MPRTQNCHLIVAVMTVCFCSLILTFESMALDSPTIDGSGSGQNSGGSPGGSNGPNPPSTQQNVTIDVGTIQSGDLCSVFSIAFCSVKRLSDAKKTEKERLLKEQSELLTEQAKLLKELEDIYWLSKVLGTAWYRKIKKQLDAVEEKLKLWFLDNEDRIKAINKQIRFFEKHLDVQAKNVSRHCPTPPHLEPYSPNFCTGVPEEVAR